MASAQTRRPFLVLAMLATLALALAGCGDREPAASAGAAEAAAPATHYLAPDDAAGFHVAELQGFSRYGRPAVRVRFSQPLAAGQDFDPLLDIVSEAGARPNGSWELEDDNTALVFPYLEADSRYTLTVKTTLAAADGSTLAEAFTQPVYSGPQPPMLGFASQGHVLPGRDSAGLPVISVNVAEADIEFLRVRERSLPAFLARFQRNGQRGGWDLQELQTLADSVYASRFALRADANQRTLNHVPVNAIDELSGAGAYFAVMRPAGQFDAPYETALFFVTDLGLHARLHHDSSFVHVASLASGRPVSGAALTLLDRHGATVAEAETDGDGNASFDRRPDREQLLVARDGDDFSLLSFRQPALDLSQFDLGGRTGGSERGVFLWAGRDLFRPGEQVRVHGLLRDHDGVAVPAAPLFARLKQPDGRVFARAQLQADALGYFMFDRTLPAQVPTGRWLLELMVEPEGDAIGDLTLRIEEFLPERLKLELDAGTGPLAPGAPLPLAVEAAYLYGAPAGGNRFLAELSFEHAGAAVEALKDFRFGDPTVALPTPAQPLVDEALDRTGGLRRDLALPEDLPRTTPIAVFTRGSVFESGGRAVSRTVKRTIWPADALVGVRPLFDPEDGADANAPVGFELARSNADGELSAASVEVVLMRDRRESTWSHDPELGWRVEYTSDWQAVGPAQTVQLAATGPTRFDTRVEWGDYRLDVTEAGSGLVTRLPFSAGWTSDDGNQGEAARPDKVKLALDRTGYRAGERLTLTLTPPHAGPGLLLVEAGDRLLSSQVLAVEAGTTVELEVLPEWERHDVHLTAIVFRPGSARERITPNRAIGIVHLPIDRRDRQVELGLQAPAEARPGDELVVTLSAPALAGRNAMATLSAVDLGIVNITRYPVPDAGEYFFAPRRPGVDAYDLYGKVIEHLDGFAATLRYGGDLALAALPQARRPTARVATVDLFSGPVAVDAAGNATITLRLPDFNGSLRLAALVWSDRHFGSAEATLQVRAPLVAEISSPRVLAPGDRSQVTLDLHNLSGRAQSLALTVTGERPLLVENGSRTVELADDARAVLTLPLTALPGQDVGRLRVQVTGDGIALDRRFELVVRPGWAPLRSGRLDQVPAASAASVGAEALASYLPGSGTLALAVSRQPPVPFASAVQGLIGYPYGCLEQTASRAFPLALLDAGSGARLGLPPLSEQARRDALDDAFGRISAMQLGNGHFSLWGGESQAQTQLTPFVAELLIEAAQAGQAIPETVLEKALVRLHEDLLAGGDRYYAYADGDALRFAVRAHAGYVLARQGRAPLGTLRAMQDNERGSARSLLSLVHLGLALHLQGDAPRGLATLRAAFGNPPQRPDWLGDYGSELRDRALGLALVRQHGLVVPEAEGELLQLARDLAGRHAAAAAEGGDAAPGLQLTTQEQLAVFRLGRQLAGDDGQGLTGTLVVGGDASTIGPTALFARSFGDAELARGVAVAIDGPGTVYVARESVGTPRTAPAAASDGVAIRREWFGSDGRPFTDTRLREGDSVIVRLTIEAEEQVEDLLVEDFLPGGLEAENLNLGDPRLLERLVVDGQPMSERAAVDLRHEEYRDDRYVAVLRLWQGQSAQLYYLARAVSPGEFAVPPPQAQDMYRPQIRAVGRSSLPRLTVTPP